MRTSSAQLHITRQPLGTAPHPASRVVDVRLLGLPGVSSGAEACRHHRAAGQGTPPQYVLKLLGAAGFASAWSCLSVPDSAVQAGLQSPLAVGRADANPTWAPAEVLRPGAWPEPYPAFSDMSAPAGVPAVSGEGC